MTKKIPAQIIILSTAFLLIFFGFGGVERYVTPFFSDRGLEGVGFNSLILLYAFFTLAEPAAAALVSRHGAKRCMVSGSLTYTIYILSLMAGSPAAIYLASVLLGFGGALLWTGQSTYLVQASKRESYGKNSGLFSTLQSLGLGAGILALGIVTAKISFEKSFLVFSVFPLMGFFALSLLREMPGGKAKERFTLMKKSLSSKTALKLSSLWLAVYFGNGLTIGALPIQIKEILGMPYVGLLSSSFFIAPVLFSYLFGNLSDRFGRRITVISSLSMLLASFVLFLFQTKAALIGGVALYALGLAAIRPSIPALTGDVSTKKNLPFLAALFWIAQGIGTVAALALSRVLLPGFAKIYLASALVAAVSLLTLATLFREDTGKIRMMISKEIGAH